MDKKKISIIAAAVLALVAVIGVQRYIASMEKQYVREEKKAFVLIATTTIPAGGTIDETMVKFESVPEKYLQPKAVNSQSLAVGRRTVAEILPGEQILATKLTLQARESSLAMRTPQGKRAMAITINPLAAVGGKVRAGDYVDLVGIFPYNAQVNGKTVTELVSVTLFQNVLILGVEGNAPPERGKPATPGDLLVTLALTPKEIALLTYALDQGRLRLVLRPPLETVIEPVAPVEANAMWQYVFSNLGQEFLAGQEAAAKPVKQEKKEEPPPPQTVEIYRGTEQSQMVMQK
jgi:pilus assembly protein CpaB